MKYAVSDIHTAAMLERRGFPALLEKDHSGRVNFFFEDPDQRFFETLDEFNRDSELQVFISHLKRLRGRMLDMRGSMRTGNGNGYGEINGNHR